MSVPSATSSSAPPAVTPSLPHACEACGTVGKVMRCARCQWAGYCNVECQKRDWNHHKTVCIEYNAKYKDYLKSSEQKQVQIAKRTNEKTKKNIQEVKLKWSEYERISKLDTEMGKAIQQGKFDLAIDCGKQLIPLHEEHLQGLEKLLELYRKQAKHLESAKRKTEKSEESWNYLFELNKTSSLILKFEEQIRQAKKFLKRAHTNMTVAYAVKRDRLSDETLEKLKKYETEQLANRERFSLGEEIIARFNEEIALLNQAKIHAEKCQSEKLSIIVCKIEELTISISDFKQRHDLTDARKK